MSAAERDLSHPYDRGYWKRVDGGPKPRPGRDPEGAKGWKDADDEILFETNPGSFA